MARIVKTPPNKLSPEIFRAYYSCHINKEEADNTGVVIDDGLFELKFTKENNISIHVGEEKFKLPQATIIGKIGFSSRIIIPEHMHLFTMKIQPWAASIFLGDEHRYITALSETTFPKINQLHEKIFSAANFTEQIECAESFFLDAHLPELRNYEMTKQICNLIYDKKGDVNVGEIVDLFPHSRQKINRLFQEQTKYSIKEFAVLTRLRAIVTHHVNNPEKSLTELSYEFGYFDQSHFIRDMKRMIGVSPLAFSKTENFFFEQLKSKS